MNKESMNMNDMNINWYPGHMKKTREQILENMKLVDVAVELLDARAPYSSSNPDIEEMVGTVPRIIVLNKSDLAEDGLTKQWISYYQSKDLEVVALNAMDGNGVRDLMKAMQRQSQQLYEKLLAKGRRKRALRVLIVGIPNVGKSSLLNRIIGKKSAKTGDRPGVTKGKQWVKLKGDMELLDTPGVLWPKIENQFSALKLAFLGSIKDQTMEIEEIAAELMKFLWERKPQVYMERFDIDSRQMESLEELMVALAKKRGCLLSADRIDYTRLANAFLLDFRSGKLGKITLETPEDITV